MAGADGLVPFVPQWEGYMESLSEGMLYALGEHVWKVEDALGGLGALFRAVGEFESLSRDEIHGIGELIVFIKNEAGKVRRTLTDQHHAPEFQEFASSSVLKKIKKTGGRRKKKRKKRKRKT